MNTTTRRILLGLGAALIVGGWGTMRYVDAMFPYKTSPEAQEALQANHDELMELRARPDYWSKREKEKPIEWERDSLKATDRRRHARFIRNIQLIRTGIMAIGAGLIGFAAIASPKKTVASE